MLGLKSKPSLKLFFSLGYFYCASLIPTSAHATIHALIISNQISTTRTDWRSLLIICRIGICQYCCARKDTTCENRKKESEDENQNLASPRLSNCKKISDHATSIVLIKGLISGVVLATIVLVAHGTTVTTLRNADCRITNLGRRLPALAISCLIHIHNIASENRIVNQYRKIIFSLLLRRFRNLPFKIIIRFIYRIMSDNHTI